MNAIPVALERDNVNDESVTICKWIAMHGEKVEKDTLIAEIETSKANIEVYAPQEGYLVWKYPQGAEVPATAAIATINSTPPEKAPNFGTDEDTATLPAGSEGDELDQMKAVLSAPQAKSRRPAQESDFQAEYKQRISPVAAKMIREHNLDAGHFGGLSVVRKQDILDYLTPSALSTAKSAVAPARPVAALPMQPYHKIDLSKAKRREGANLSAGVGNALQSNVSVLCFTRGLRSAIERRSPGAGFSAVLMFEVGRLLRKYCMLNATYREGCVLQFEQVNVGFAFDDGSGLKVGVVPACDTRSVPEIVSDLRQLTEAYLGNKLTPTQISNGTFTISDLSGMGVSSFFPLIGENQGAILGVGAEEFMPESKVGVFSLTLTFDHQISDGRTAAAFLGDLKSRLAAYEDSVAASPIHELHCHRCFRSAQDLKDTDQYLVQSAIPQGYLCTVCISGY